VRVPSGFLANDVRAVRQAAEIGYGIAFLPLLGVFDELHSGKLVRLLSGFPASGIPVIASQRRNVFDGPWYSIIIAVMPFVVGLLLLPETKDRDITKRRSFRDRTRLGFKPRSLHLDLSVDAKNAN